MSKYQRLAAKFLFAKEIRAGTETFTIENEDTKYDSIHTISPTGQDVGRVYICGTLTEMTDIGDNEPYYKGRLVDPTGAILVYAGKYQPDAATAMSSLDVPVYVAITGKISIFTTEDGTKIPSIRAESVSIVDEDTLRTFTFIAAGNLMDHLEQGQTDMKAKATEVYGDVTDEYKKMAIGALKSQLDK